MAWYLHHKSEFFPCRRCGAMVYWRKCASTGRYILCEPGSYYIIPSLAGKYFGLDGKGRLIRGDAAQRGTPGGMEIYLAHEFNCRKAERRTSLGPKG